MFTTRQTILCLSLSIFAFSGCSSLTKQEAGAEKKGFFAKMPWSKDKKPKPYAMPVKVAATWSPDTLTQSGRMPTRGFGARVFFYDEKSRPVPVDGTLVVHGFDESAEDPATGTKRFEFTPEQFTQHYSSSELGASYSIWIPWDAVGGPQSRVSLVATFRTKDGHTIQGTPTTVLLPGTKDNSAAALAKRYSPEFRRWQQASSGDLTPQSGLTTTTIQRSAPGSLKPTPQVENYADPTPTWNLAKQSSTPAADVAMRATIESPATPAIVSQPPSPASSPTTLRTVPASTRLPVTRP